MPSETYEIEDEFFITRGDDFALPVNLGEDVSMHEYSAQVRTDSEASDAIDFNVDTSLASTGYVVISLTDAQTRAMTESRYVFDFQETSDTGYTVTLFTAGIRIRGDVTR